MFTKCYFILFIPIFTVCPLRLHQITPPPRDILPGDYHPQRKFANWHQPVLPTLTDTRGEEFFKNGTNTRTPDDIRLGAGNPLGGYLQGGGHHRAPSGTYSPTDLLIYFVIIYLLFTGINCVCVSNALKPFCGRLT